MAGQDGAMPPTPRMLPMLATATDVVPVGAEWVHEVKWDGMRVVAEIRSGELTLWSRNGREVTASYPELAELAASYEDLVLDGEVVALDGGRPSFSALVERMHVADSRKAARLSAIRPVTFMLFDLLVLFGSDLTGQPWTARRELLERLDLHSRHWQVPPTYDDGRELVEATLEQGLEGVVSKRRASSYLPGRRSPQWRKLAHRRSLSVVVGGWRPEVGSTTRLGAVLVGVPDGAGGWVYAGRVGSGLAGAASGRLAAALAPLVRETSPFAGEVPRVDADGATWVEPEVVVEVRTLGRTEGGRLRQPAYLGVRHDLVPADLAEADDA